MKTVEIQALRVHQGARVYGVASATRNARTKGLTAPTLTTTAIVMPSVYTSHW